jgi:hypothetical protein
MGYKKAQISGLDLILAIILFSMAIILFSILWNVVQYNVTTSADADIIAIQVANRLLDSPGYPSDWNSTNVQLIGLSSERGVMDQSKFENLIALLSQPGGYDEVRQLLGLGPYQFYINLTYPDGSPVLINGQPAVGGDPPTNATTVSSIRRTALYGTITVYNNSITFVQDSSGSMDWFSTGINYTNSNLSARNVWVNIYNVSFPSSPTSSFDFILEFNDTSLVGGNEVKFNVTSPSGKKYSVPSSGSSCGSGTAGCTAFSYSGGARMNFTQALWNSTGVWQVWIRKSVNNPITYDSFAQTPPRRIDAAKTAIDAFVDVISNESKGIDEMSLFDFNGCNSDMINGFTTNYQQIKSNVNSITASGSTPLAQAIRDAADYTNSSSTRKHNMIIVVSDGQETCGGDIIAAATYAAGKVQKICTVGLEQGGDGATQLKQAAKIGHCQYYAARNEQQLEFDLRQLYFGSLQKENVLLNIVVWR